ncbi:MAG: hypothetical protein SNG10_00550 [Rikenellaceae bacterium]
MKKILFIFAVMICTVVTASAQISKGESTISAKIGIGDSSYGIPTTITYENALWGINDASCVTLGGSAGFGLFSDSNIFYVGLRGAYHYAINKWDLLGALTIGGNIASSADNPMFNVSVGANYFFSESWAVGAELGYGISFANVGVTYKF